MASEKVERAIAEYADSVWGDAVHGGNFRSAARAALVAAIEAECEAAELREFQHHCVHLWDEAGLCIHCGASKP